MEKWEKALNKFIDKWKNRKDVTGILVCGSYVTGNPTRHSDIDLHIILDAGTDWRERGNEIIDGILIEYFANPARTHQSYAENDYKNRKRMNAHMFLTGKVLFDKTGELKTLVEDAKKQYEREYRKPGKAESEIAMYLLWDRCDNLEEVYEAGNGDFPFVYFNDLYALFDVYSGYLQFDKIPPFKLMRLLTNESDKKKYRIPDFPDNHFLTIFVKAMQLKDSAEMMETFQSLTAYVLDKMGGIEIHGWKIRGPAE